MKCRRCGHENDPEFRFCENCGLNLERESEKTAQDELEIPSIFEDPVEYRGKYSDAPVAQKKRSVTLPSFRFNKRVIGILASLVILLLIYVFASQYGRANDQIPPVIQEYADAVRAKDTARLQEIILSSSTLQPPNPNSFAGFLRVMEISGRLNESVRNLEVDLSHLLQDPAYVSNLPVKLLLLDADGEREYRIGVETFDVKVGQTGATIDGQAPDADGIFQDYLMGQYTLEYEINRFPLLLDATNPQLADGTIIPVQLTDAVADEVPEQTEALTEPGEGTLEIVIETDAANGRIRINEEDTSLTVGDDPVRMNPGDRLQVVDIWQGGVGLSEEITIRQAGTVELPIRYDTKEFRDRIYQQVRAMLVEDAQMLTERNEDGFTTLVGTALEKGKDNVRKLINGNQHYAGTYDRVAFDPESFRLDKNGAATVHVIGRMTYVYQTYTIGTTPPNVDDLWRDEVVMSFDLVLDPDTGQWLTSDWGRTGEELSGAAQVIVDILP